MGGPSHCVNYSAKVVDAPNVNAGKVIVNNAAGISVNQDSVFVLASAVNRALYGRADGIAISSAEPDVDNSVLMVTCGRVDASFTGLGAGVASWVRVSSLGLCERVASPTLPDDIIGWCETNGDLHAMFGYLTSTLVNGGIGGVSGTGFVRVIAGVTQSAASVPDLSSSDTTGTLALARVVAPTGTGVVRVSGGAWVSAGSKGTASQLLATNAGATDVEWISLLPLATLTPGTNGQYLVTAAGVAAWASPGASTYVAISDGTSITWAQIANANVSASAAIAVSKLAAGTNGQYLQTTGGAPTWTSPGTSAYVAVSNGSAITWAQLVNANVASGAAIDTSKLAIPGSATEVMYRNAGALGAAAKTSIAADGSLQVGASGWATTGNIRHPKGSSVYARNAANSADLAIWSLNAAADRCFVGTDAGQNASATFDYLVLDALSYVEFGASSTPSAVAITDPYCFMQGPASYSDAKGATQWQGKLVFRTTTGTTPQSLWGSGGIGVLSWGNTDVEPTAGHVNGGLVWSSATALKHASSGGIINQLSHGENMFSLPNAATATISVANGAQQCWTFRDGSLAQACLVTISGVPTAGDATDAYYRLVDNRCTSPDAVITLTTGSGTTAIFNPSSRALIRIDATYGVTVIAIGTGVVSGGGVTTVAAGGSTTQAQYNLAGVLAGMANVLYSAGGRLQFLASPQWKNGANLGDLAWTPTAARTLTLPDATDTLVGKATADTLTNKTFDTAGTGNVFKINGTGITDKTGTGKAVLDTSPTISGLTTSGTTTIAALTGILKGASGVVSAVAAPAGAIVGDTDTQTLTNKTIAGASNTLTVRAASDITGQLPAANGGTGISTSASTGVPSVAAGTWSVAATLAATKGGTAQDSSAWSGVVKTVAGVWSAIAQVTAALGGTGIDTSGSTGVPKLAAGVWSIIATLTAALGGTGLDTSASTGVASVASGTWAILTRLTAALGGTNIDTSASTGIPKIVSGTWSVIAAVTAALGGTGLDTSASTGVATISAGTWSILATLSTALGGLGANNGSASGVPVFASGVCTVTAVTGTGAPVLGTSPTITSPTIAGLPVISGTGLDWTGNAKGIWHERAEANLQTTNATATVIDSFTIPNNTAIQVVYYWLGVKNDYSAMGAYIGAATFRNNAGTVTAVFNGAILNMFAGTTWGSTPSIAASGTTIQIKVTGTAATTGQHTVHTFWREVTA